ncbi:MAG: DUF6691 family protein [Acetobacter papayae]|uniref:DUF6691 family protein n=1 Tax=Acetobacter papayae TaxID=1076592 RepID=UPI0039EC4AE4
MVLRSIAAFACGLVFSLGLILGGMLDPARVLAFLDLAGVWNPALLFVLGGAVCVAFVGVRLARHLKRPVLDQAFALPVARQIDAPLVVGNCLFGLGWGMAGFCPGPAVASVGAGVWQGCVFTAAMLTGMLLFERVKPAR